MAPSGRSPVAGLGWAACSPSAMGCVAGGLLALLMVGREPLEEWMTQEQTYECDVLVIGSGASGMAAAVTAALHGLKVLIAEKEPRFGGTTARSGGWLWIPGTSLAKSWGINETPELARTYIQHEAGSSFDRERVDAFIDNGPRAVDFFISKTAVRFD